MSKKAFTLIEVLVVVAIIALLIAILLPSLAAARRASKQLVCETNLRTIAQATFLYTGDNKDSMPSLPEANPDGTTNGNSGNPWEMLFPYVAKISPKITPTSNNAFVNIPTFLCPEDIKPHTTSQKIITTPYGDKHLLLNLGYGVNTSIEWKTRPSGSTPGKIGKVTNIKSACEMVWYTDNGDDGCAGAGPWILVDCATYGQNQCDLEVHHKTGNNFVYMDTHVVFKNIIWKKTAGTPDLPIIQWGLPLFPTAWIPNCNGIYKQGTQTWTAATWNRAAPVSNPALIMP